MTIDNVVNMDTRTVISAINYGSIDTLNVASVRSPLLSKSESNRIYALLCNDQSYMDIENILSWMTNLKSKYELFVERIPLQHVNNWTFDGNTIYNNTKRYFTVIGTQVKIANREVTTWDQPMIKPAQEGLIGFIVKKSMAYIIFLFRRKLRLDVSTY